MGNKQIIKVGFIVLVSIFLVLIIIFIGVRSRGPIFNTKSSKTNLNGDVFFIDDSTKEIVTVEVSDSEGLLPISNINVTFYDGDNAEIFYVEDPNGIYLPSIEVCAHNSIHKIKMGKANKGFYYIARLDDEAGGKALYKWENHLKMDWVEAVYQKTINYDEVQTIMDRTEAIVKLQWKAITYLLGIKVKFTPADIIHKIAPDDPNHPQRWDVYSVEGKYLGTQGAGYITLIPSNVPTVLITSLIVDDTRRLSASWQGSDKTIYPDYPQFLPGGGDITVALGSTLNPDLIYKYRILNSDNSIYHDWTDSLTPSCSVDNIHSGNYHFEIEVKDEVNNINKTRSDFSIPTPSETKQSIPKPEVVNSKSHQNNLHLSSEQESDLKRTVNTFWEIILQNDKDRRLKAKDYFFSHPRGAFEGFEKSPLIFLKDHKEGHGSALISTSTKYEDYRIEKITLIGRSEDLAKRVNVEISLVKQRVGDFDLVVEVLGTVQTFYVTPNFKDNNPPLIKHYSPNRAKACQLWCLHNGCWLCSDSLAPYEGAIWDLLKEAKPSEKRYFLCVNPFGAYKIVNDEKRNFTDQEIEQIQNLSEKISSFINMDKNKVFEIIKACCSAQKKHIAGDERGNRGPVRYPEEYCIKADLSKEEIEKIKTLSEYDSLFILREVAKK